MDQEDRKLLAQYDNVNNKQQLICSNRQQDNKTFPPASNFHNSHQHKLSGHVIYKQHNK